MFDFHEKRKIRSVLYSRPVVAFLCICTIILSFSVYHRYTVAREMKAKLSDREQELSELRSRAELLESKVEYLKNERGIEEELRNRFDVVKEGEQVIILIDEPEVSDKPSFFPMSEDARVDEDQSFVDRLRFWD
jgi:cell division protein FtsB